MTEQLCMFEEQKPAANSCYSCEHFAEFKEPRTYKSRDGEFTVYGECCKNFNKNGSYSMYPVYIPQGVCKNFKKKKGTKTT